MVREAPDTGVRLISALIFSRVPAGLFSRLSVRAQPAILVVARFLSPISSSARVTASMALVEAAASTTPRRRTGGGKLSVLLRGGGHNRA